MNKQYQTKNNVDIQKRVVVTRGDMAQGGSGEGEMNK